MKKTILLVAIAATVFTGCKSEKKSVALNQATKIEVEEAKTNNVDLTSSVLNWKGTKPLGAHNGIVALESGSLLVENDELKGGEFVVDLGTIKCTDLSGKEAGKLESHLKSADFFDIEKHPTSTFVITSVKENGEKLEVTGNLQIKEVTKSITIPATLINEDGIYIFKSEVFNINRADFNVRYGSKSFFDNLKDKFIDDIIEMSFEVKTEA